MVAECTNMRLSSMVWHAQQHCTIWGRQMVLLLGLMDEYTFGIPCFGYRYMQPRYPILSTDLGERTLQKSLNCISL